MRIVGKPSRLNAGIKLQEKKSNINENGDERLDSTHERVNVNVSKTYKLAKNQVNLGDVSRAMNTIMSKGIAPITEEVLSNLHAKHPIRRRPVVDPSVEEVICMRRAEGTAVLGPEKLTKIDYADSGRGAETEEISDESLPRKAQAVETLDTLMPVIQIGALDVIESAMKAKRTVSGGLQQITPWMLKVAMTATNNSRAPFYAAMLTNRWAKGDYSLAIGELCAMSKLVALWKDDARTDVRPVGIGGALRRLLTKTYCSQIKTQFVY